MEAIIILIILSILIYLIVQNSTSNKIANAKKHVSKGNYAEAQKIFLSLKNKHHLAIAEYADCFYKQGLKIKITNTAQALYFFQKAIDSKSLQTQISAKENFENIEALAFYEISRIKFSEIIAKRNTEVAKIDELKANLEFIKNSTKTYHTDEFKKLEIEHFQKLGELYYEVAKSEEKSGVLTKAIDNYTNSYANLKSAENKDQINNTIFRKMICVLKNGQEISSELIRKLIKINHPYKKDLLFRSSKRLLENKKFSEAEYIITEGLKDCHGAVDILREVCHNEKVRNAKFEIDKINNWVERIYSGPCSDDDLLQLYLNINSKFKEIVKIFPDIESQLSDLKPTLFNRLLISYLDKGLYINAMKMITNLPSFFCNPGVMKNLGNITLNILEKGEISQENYMDVISHFLTSAYSDKVMLYSLHSTSWDDEYTFTLYNSLGSAYKFHSDLPENVNYDEPSETNISIGDAQRDLIKQFELLLAEKISSSDLREEAQAFYLAEQNALEGIISKIKEETLFMTPYFSDKYGLGYEILDYLGNLYLEEEDEAALDLGIQYNSQNQNYIIKEYSIAKEILSKLIKAIEVVAVDTFEKTSTSSNITNLLKYKSIKNSFEDELVKAFYEATEVYELNEDIVKIMKLAIKISPGKSKLKFQYANYVAGLCINKVNSDEMTNLKALAFMCDAYQAVPNNLRVCKNLITLIKMNIFDTLSGIGNNQVYKLIDNITPSLSTTFIQNSEELSEARKEFMTHLPPSSMVAILTGDNLTEKGRIMKKALDYLGMLSGTKMASDPVEELRRFL
jgi:hypothetical protein